MSDLNIGQGQVYHKRHGKAENQFRYPLYFLFFNTDAEPRLQKIFQRGLWNLFSFQPRDYMDRRAESGNFSNHVKSFLKEKCNYDAEEVWLQTMPAILGFVFNPISFWVCRRDQRIEAVLCEVNNTFGERHFYWIAPPDKNIQPEQWFQADKVFHVSPFFPVEGFYKFKFKFTDTATKVDILYHSSQGELVLTTSVQGSLLPVEHVYPLGLIFKYGWMTPLVLLRIHYQAVKLWLKKATFYSKPELPDKDVTP